MKRHFILFLIFYSFGSAILLLVIFLVPLFFPGSRGAVGFGAVKIAVCSFSLNLVVLGVTVALPGVILLVDYCFVGNLKTALRNQQAVSRLLGGMRHPVVLLVTGLLSGLFEEVLFRGYGYILLVTFLPSSFWWKTALIITVSLLFGLLHLSQGIRAFIAGFVISLIFAWGCALSGSIWYAVIAHALFNYIELSFVFPHHTRMLERR